MERLIRPTRAEVEAEGVFVDLEAIRLSSERFWKDMERIELGDAYLTELWPTNEILREQCFSLYYAGELYNGDDDAGMLATPTETVATKTVATETIATETVATTPPTTATTTTAMPTTIGSLELWPAFVIRYSESELEAMIE